MRRRVRDKWGSAPSTFGAEHLHQPCTIARAGITLLAFDAATASLLPGCRVSSAPCHTSFLEEAVQHSRSRTITWPFHVLIVLSAACAPALESGQPATSSPARDAYIRERARASDPSIARWSEAGDRALRTPMSVELPYTT